MKKVLHITERKQKSNVHHYYKSDDFRAGFEVAKWRTFCHSRKLQISPAHFKQVYSDKAVRPAESRAFQVRGLVFSSLDTIRVIGNNTTKYSSAPTTIGVAFTNWDCRS